MQTVDAPKSTPFSETVYTGEALIAKYARTPREAPEVLFELWAWVAGLESFVNVFDRSIGDNARAGAATRSRKPEFHLTRAALIRISDLIVEWNRSGADDKGDLIDLTSSDLSELSAFIQDSSILNNALLHSDRLGYAEWKTWRMHLAGRVTALKVSHTLEAAAPSLGKHFLPVSLRRIADIDHLDHSEKVSIDMVSVRLSLILRTLQIINTMLRADEPLKPTLLLFCSVYEQIRGMTEYVNNLLSRNPNEESEIFGLLDGASYMAALELKKAYNQELTGILALRPAPAVFARVESAYALLNDSFQQILTSFAKLSEPKISTSDIFPDFHHKLTESLLLRSHLSQAMTAVKAAEQDPEKEQIERLRLLLTSFLDEPIKFLFYKDRESVERFCEEVQATNEKKDLVPILHRFAAYLETLFRQVSMRTVLSNHPFEG